jgi:hypothetical protein
MDKYHKTMLPDGWEIVVAKNLAEVESLRPVWEKLQREETYPVPNADIDRFISVIKPLQDTVRPHIILLRYKGSSEAMAIGRVGRIDLNCRIGYKTLFRPALKGLSIAYGGLIGKFTDEALCILLQELRIALAKKEVDVVTFNHLRTDAPIHQLVRKKTNILCRHHFPLIERHWQTLIPSPSEGLDRIISKKHQRDIQRCVRNLEKTGSGPVRFVCYQKKEEIQEFMDIASSISYSTYQGRMGRGFVADSLTRSLLSQSQENGWLRTYVLYAGSEPVAFEYGCLYRDRYFAEQAGYDLRWNAYSPGTILQLKIFERLSLNDKVVTYDYGLGDAIYKQRLGSVSWPEASLYLFAPRLYPVVINLLDSSIRGMSIGIFRGLQKLKLTDKVKRWWRRGLTEK